MDQSEGFKLLVARGQPASPFLQPDRVSEAEFQRTVVAWARACGWKVHHSRPAQNSRGKWSTPIQGDPGLPDLILARAGRVMFLELKSERGRVSAAQKEWLAELGMETVPVRWEAGALEVAVARPSDWPLLSGWLL